MQSFEECLLLYRMRVRQILANAGVPSNPGSDDIWLLDELQKLVPGPPPLTVEKIPEPMLQLVGKCHDWDSEVARMAIGRTMKILELNNANDAISFLVYRWIPGVSLVVCDGCNVNLPFEHRCHGDRAMVSGEQTGKPCRCVDCFVVEHLLTAV